MATPPPNPHGLDKVFCPLPWTSLCAHLDGVYARCCVDASGQNATRYHGPQPTRLTLRPDTVGCSSGSPFAADNPQLVMSLEEAFNSPALRATRLAMLAGRPVSACRDCYERERVAGDSYRLQMMRQEHPAPGVDACRSRTDADGAVPGFPVFLDLRLGNHCNLRCVMCDVPTSSSLLATRPNTWLRSSLDPYSEESSFWRSLENNLHHIRSLYLVGGEPLLLPAHQRLLRFFVDRERAGTVDLTYATNLTVLSPAVLKLWPQFRKVSLEASCECVGSVFQRIRVGGRWSVFARNVERVRPFVDLSIHVSPQRDNVMHLGDVIDWALERGLPIHLSNVIRDPAHLCVRNLAPERKHEAERYLTPLVQRMVAVGELQIAADVNSVLSFVLATPTLVEDARA